MQSTMEMIYSLWFLFMAYISYSDAKLDSKVKQIFHTYDFQGESGLLQFWECSTHEGTNDNGCSLTLTDQYCMSNMHDNRLLDYRMRCFDNSDRFIGQQTNVGIWFAGRAAQTGLADHRVRHVVLNHDHQYIDEASGMGQLVVPVYFNHPGAGIKLAGIIELITTQPKESYVADFNQIHNLLMRENLTSTYMGKTIKVEYNHHIVKFQLPFSAKLPDLQKQVTMRFKEWENKALRIIYEDTNSNCHSILSDNELNFCIAESISSRTSVIRMYIEENLTEKVTRKQKSQFQVWKLNSDKNIKENWHNKMKSDQTRVWMLDGLFVLQQKQKEQYVNFVEVGKEGTVERWTIRGPVGLISGR